MITTLLTPLQAEFGTAYGLLSAILLLLAFYFLWSIRRNVRQMTADVERIREATEDQESNEQR